MSYKQTFMRRCAIVALTAVFVTLPAAASAQSVVTLDFNTLTETVEGSGTRFVDNCYMERGFVLTAIGVPCSGAAAADAFLAVGPNSPLFGGDDSPSMVLNSPDAAEIGLARIGGGVFDLRSIALSGFFDSEMTNVLFTGSTMSGIVTQMFDVGPSQQTFGFNGDFVNLTAIRITALNEFDEPLVNFDDIELVVASSVPEPATLALMLAGMIGLSVVSRRRRA